jgi:DNA-binding NtrC family response regulator
MWELIPLPRGGGTMDNQRDLPIMAGEGLEKTMDEWLSRARDDSLAGDSMYTLAMQAFEKGLIETCLAKHSFCIKSCAAALGISYDTLSRRLKSLGIRRKVTFSADAVTLSVTGRKGKLEGTG